MVLAIAFIGCVAANVVSADDDTIPSRFTFKFGGDPIWISASEAITASGALRPEVQRPESLKYLMSRLEQEKASRRNVASDAHEAGDSCDVNYGRRFEDGPDDFSVRSLAQLKDVAASRSVISGVLSASAVGLYDGIPYTVLQIDRASVEAGTDRVYLLYPRGRLRFDNLTFCNSDPSFSELPAIGDPITFVVSAPIDSTGTLFMTSGSWVLYEHEAALVSPPELRLDPEIRRLKSVRAITDHLRTRQQRGDQP